MSPAETIHGASCGINEQDRSRIPERSNVAMVTGEIVLQVAAVDGASPEGTLS
jgi:hypothetical protein